MAASGKGIMALGWQSGCKLSGPCRGSVDDRDERSRDSGEGG